MNSIGGGSSGSDSGVVNFSNDTAMEQSASVLSSAPATTEQPPRRARRCYGASGRDDAIDGGRFQRWMFPKVVPKKKEVPKVSPSAIKGVIVQTLPCGTVKTMTWDDDLCRPVYHYIKPDVEPRTTTTTDAGDDDAAIKMSNGKGLDKENVGYVKIKSGDTTLDSGGREKKRRLSANDFVGRKSSNILFSVSDDYGQSHDDNNNHVDAAAAAVDKPSESKRLMTGPSRLGRASKKSRRGVFGSRQRTGRDFTNTDLDIDLLIPPVRPISSFSSKHSSSGSAPTTATVSQSNSPNLGAANAVTQTPTKYNTAKHVAITPGQKIAPSSTLKSPRKSPRNVNEVASFQTPTSRKAKKMPAGPFYPGPSTSLDLVRKYFEELDQSDSLAVSDDNDKVNNLKTPQMETKPGRYRRKLRLSDPALVHEYSEYQSALNASNITPLSIKTYAQNRYFFRKELYDGILDG